MERKYDLVLLLALISAVSRGPAAEASVVSTAPTVRGWKGEDIRLRCDVEEEPFGVYWDMVSTLQGQQRRTTKATFFDGVPESREERFNIDENFSLVITELEVADEGRYYCEAVLQNLESVSNSTFMTVSSKASKHAIEECVDETQSHQSLCSYQPPSDDPSVTLTCVVGGFKPNISMLWTDESGKRMDSVVSQQKTLSDNTYERFETITVLASHETEQTFTCMAAGDSLNGTSTVGITVLPSIPGFVTHCFCIG
ncbi:uncharacterized protein [Diadema antillarum]|uniref:uncharacterized protein n=1 Tax=Diadema antillarum TaxID=105358 RepID=UPI003A8B645D